MGLFEVIQESGLVVTLETNWFPTMTLAGGPPSEPNPLIEWLMTMLQPTIKVNGAVLYAPKGPAGS